MKNEYITINKSVLEKRIEELKEISPLDRLCYDGMIECEERVLKQILSQSTPLIPEIEKAFDAGIDFISDASDFPMGDAKKKDSLSKEDYISNLKLDI